MIEPIPVDPEMNVMLAFMRLAELEIIAYNCLIPAEILNKALDRASGKIDA